MSSVLSALNSFRNYFNVFLDIFLLSCVIYGFYKYAVDTSVMVVLKGLFLFSFVFLFAYLLDLKTMLWLIEKSIEPLFIVSFIIVYPEIRKILINIGNISFLKKEKSSGKIGEIVGQIVDACVFLSKKRRGALVVFEMDYSLKNIIETGVEIDSNVRKELITSIFEYNTELHDGALIISKSGKISAASCVLPLSNRRDIEKNFGTRHRAAIGVTENTDVIALVVSEESGAISIAYKSKIYYSLDAEEVKNELCNLLSEPKNEVGNGYEKGD